MFRNCSWQEWLHVMLLALWILESVLGGPIDNWTLKAKVLTFALYAIGLISWVISSIYNLVFRRGFDRSTNNISISFWWTSSASIGLFFIPAGLFLSVIVKLVLVGETGLARSNTGIMDPRGDLFFVAEELDYLICEAWMVWGILRKGSPAMASLPGVTTAVVVAEGCQPMAESHEWWFRRLPPSINLLLGWVHTTALEILFELCLSDLVMSRIGRAGRDWAYFALTAMIWCALLWAGVCVATSNTKGVAFWFVAKFLLSIVVSCVSTLTEAAGEGSIK